MYFPNTALEFLCIFFLENLIFVYYISLVVNLSPEHV